MSSTSVDIANNIPEKFNLDMPGRISDRSHGYNYVLVVLFKIFYDRSLRTLFSRIQFNFHNETASLTFVDIVNKIPDKFNWNMPDMILDMTSWVHLWRDAFCFKYLTADFSELVSRIQITFENENLSSTFVDIINYSQKDLT